jgi:hypothetical protein
MEEGVKQNQDHLLNLSEIFLELRCQAKDAILNCIDQYLHALKELHDDVSMKYLIELKDALASAEKNGQNQLIHDLATFRQILWEKLHVVHWMKTNLVYRSLFGDITSLLITSCFLCRPGVEIEKLVFTADMGLLLGSPDSSYILNRIVSLLSPSLSESRTSPKLPSPVSSSSIPTQSMMKVLPDIHDSATQAVPTIAEPSVLSFYEDHFVNQTPVVLTHCADDWPALSNPERSWQNLSYISEGKQFHETLVYFRG